MTKYLVAVRVAGTTVPDLRRLAGNGIQPQSGLPTLGRLCLPIFAHLSNGSKPRIDSNVNGSIAPQTDRIYFVHAVGKAPAYNANVPPATLLHGTSLELITIIRQHGLDGKDRAYVHLTTSFSYAHSVANTHKPSGTIVEVLSGDAARAGIRFFRATETI